MPATTTAEEQSGDLQGVVIKTDTQESFTEIEPPEIGQNNLRSFRLAHTDGKYTLTRELWQFAPGSIYTGDGNTSSEPIETHPKLAGLTEKQRRDWTLWKQNPNDPLLNGWDPSTDSSVLVKALYNWYIKGVTTYLAPKVTVRLTTFDTDPPSFNEVGKIGVPGGGFDFNGNYLLTGITFSKEGTKWRISREYLGSQQGATWDPVLYGTQNPT